MKTPFTLHLRDLGKPLVDAWERQFNDVPGVTISCGDIFSSKPGPIVATDPIDVKADAIVSPANSFGYMDGGIDAVYTYQLGPQVQRELQARLARDFGGELPVGSAVIIPTGHRDIPWCISAPTMRVPSFVGNTLNAYLAMRAALTAVLVHNEEGNEPIRTVLCPGLGTAVGKMPVERCARQMRAAWDRVVGGKPLVHSTLREAAIDEAWLLE